jgi:hypothetical protein
MIDPIGALVASIYAVFSQLDGGDMRFGPFLIIGFLLFLLWVGGFVIFHTAGFLIHILLVLAVISIIVHFFAGTRRTSDV